MIVLLHGFLMDSSLWAAALADLSTDFRCFAPILPIGAHRHGMPADAGLSLPGIARPVAEFLDRLDLHDVTLVGNDTGGALVQLLVRDGSPRIVLASCEAFDNFPAGLIWKTLSNTRARQQLRECVLCVPCDFGTPRPDPTGGIREGSPVDGSHA